MPSTYYEDLTVGDSISLGSTRVTAAEIVEFAERYDPQWFHTDPERADESMYGGLIASGWHTASLTMRLVVDGFLTDAASLGSPGVDRLRWPAPVRPGDELTARAEVRAKPQAEERPHRGTVRTTIESTVDGETVLSMTANIMIGRRDG